MGYTALLFAAFLENIARWHFYLRADLAVFSERQLPVVRSPTLLSRNHSFYFSLCSVSPARKKADDGNNLDHLNPTGPQMGAGGVGQRAFQDMFREAMQGGSLEVCAPSGMLTSSEANVHHNGD